MIIKGGVCECGRAKDEEKENYNEQMSEFDRVCEDEGSLE